MTSRKTVPHIKCQRCKHHHATHSILGTILLCEDCYRVVFPTIVNPILTNLMEDK